MTTEQLDRLFRKVAALRRGTATFLKEADAAHQSMATEQGQRLDEQTERCAVARRRF